MVDPPFPDRVAAGRALGHRLHDLNGQQPAVLALPNGGVVVAAEVARSLASPLDVIGVHKLRTPSEPELAVGAVAEDGVQVVNQVLVEEAGLSADAWSSSPRPPASGSATSWVGTGRFGRPSRSRAGRRCWSTTA
jgi:putative phosphoribosyl transferase